MRNVWELLLFSLTYDTININNACLFLDWIRLFLFNLIKIKSLAQWIKKLLKRFFAKILKIFKITFEE